MLNGFSSRRATYGRAAGRRNGIAFELGTTPPNDEVINTGIAPAMLDLLSLHSAAWGTRMEVGERSYRVGRARQDVTSLKAGLFIRLSYRRGETLVGMSSDEPLTLKISTT